MQHHASTFTAYDDAGAPYVIDVWCETPDRSAGPVELRHRGTLVRWVSRGVYRVKAGFTPTDRDVCLTCADPDAP